MKKTFFASLIPILLFYLSNAYAYTVKSVAQQVFGDYHAYYATVPGLTQQLVGLGVAGIMANTNFDPYVEEQWQYRYRGRFTDDLSTYVDSYSEISQYKYAIPLYITSMCFSDNPLGTWGNHSLRTLILGAPQQAVLTHALGAGRPITQQHQWDLFKYDRAVSGHAFYGAIPLLNMAKQTPNIFLKSSLYVLSTLPGLARINSDKHYFSQSFLGWWIAFAATNAVWNADIVSKEPYKLSFQVNHLENAFFLGFNLKF